jgi:arginyl-tRNA--protein-N-Asp/Glu arginylyltransferase
MNRDTTERLDLYITPEHPCGYIDGRMARTVFVDPDLDMDNRLYSLLASHGFRRNGPNVYRPHCEGCKACVPLRIPVAEFQPDRSQARVWKRNQDLRISVLDAVSHPEHFSLYRRYLEARHPGGGMDGSGEPEYAHFLMNPWGRTRMVAMQGREGLAAVAVMDELDDALSAVYTFYEPALGRRSLGTFAILWQIEEARRRGLRWLYLGYWIAESRKMAYKDRFRPYEQLGTDGWQRSA